MRKKPKNIRLIHTLSLISVAVGVIAFKIFEAHAPLLAWMSLGVMMAITVGWIALLYWTRGRSPK